MDKGDLKAVIGILISMLIGTIIYKAGKYLVTGEFYFGANDIMDSVPVFIGCLFAYIIVNKTRCR
jgi:Na+/glutamate symporter